MLIERRKNGVKNKFIIEQMLCVDIEYRKSNYKYFSLGIKNRISDGYCYRLIIRDLRII